MSKCNYWRVFFPRKQYAYDRTCWDDLPPGTFKTVEQILAGKGEWPERLVEKFKAQMKFNEIWLDAYSPEIDDLISLFEKEKGFKPFSYLEGRYKYSKTKPSPFKFFGFAVNDGSGALLSMDDGINFENQMLCDYPAHETAIKGNKGCGRQKKQIAPFRLEKKPGRIPVRDFFNFWAGSRLPDFRIYGISAKARELILENNITGCEILPIMEHDGETPSGIYQLTITGEVKGAVPTTERLANLKPCRICGYTSIGRKTQPDVPMVIQDNFFSDCDLQRCDRVRVEGKEFRGLDILPWLFASAKFVRMCKENKLKGISFVPSLLESEVEQAGLLDETIFPVMKIE